MSGGDRHGIGHGGGRAGDLRGGDGQQIGHAVAMALKNLMGLICDPVAGLVEVPCVKRNVIGAVNAVSVADMAMAGITSQIPWTRSSTPWARWAGGCRWSSGRRRWAAGRHAHGLNIQEKMRKAAERRHWT